MPLPHIDVIVWLLIAVVVFYGVVTWMGMVFQGLLFKRYRDNRNEAARREVRIHEKGQKDIRFRNSLLGEVKGEIED